MCSQVLENKLKYKNYYLKKGKFEFILAKKLKKPTKQNRYPNKIKNKVNA